MAQVSLKSVVALAAATVIAAPAAGQRPAAEQRVVYEAHRADFDHLLGDWEFTAVSRQYGTSRGLWSAVRLGDRPLILDAFRIVGDSGETYHVTHTLRAYNANQDQWELVSTDSGSGLQNLGTAHRVGSEMHIDQRFGVGSANPSLWRIRYYDIQPDRFSWTGDRSSDDGRTWVTDWLTIEAHRIGPARVMDPLAHARKP